ncbi:MAG: homoserine kinase [Alphaproteobacteria bacterium]|nr:homoserine kinase [Alphaproteobacteria bacterium]MCB9984495.1 homoserine kinase [Micavibrio sp.]
MAVYTHLSDHEISDLLTGYNIGSFISATGILQGIDNTNYKVSTDEGAFILTIFESRIAPDDLPFFLSFMDHLYKNGIRCPAPVLRNDSSALSFFDDKPAALFPFLDGHGVDYSDIIPVFCFELGVVLGNMHTASQSFPLSRINSMGIEAWDYRLRKVGESAKEFIDILEQIKCAWPTSLPHGVIHADFFPDNVFILDGHIHAIIDFYFSATDFLAYDLAIALNAWCFSSDHTLCAEKSQSFLDGYQSVRPLTQEEKDSFQILCQGACLRFLSSRLYDLTFLDPKALVTPKDPTEYIKKLEFHCANKIF